MRRRKTVVAIRGYGKECQIVASDRLATGNDLALAETAFWARGHFGSGVGGAMAKDVLGLVIPDLYHSTGTFLHEHIANIVPGRSVVIHLSSTGQEAQTVAPVLEIPARPSFPSGLRHLNVAAGRVSPGCHPNTKRSPRGISLAIFPTSEKSGSEAGWRL